MTKRRPNKNRDAKKKRVASNKTSSAKWPPRLYQLEVSLASGPITEAFAKKNKVVSRTIAIRGDNTLEDLHHAIFDAFDREEQHMYEFQFGKGFHDPHGQRYGLSPGNAGGKPVGDVATTLDALNLKRGRAFGYWFDFGDDWLHQIDVVAVEKVARRGKYPKVLSRIGSSPPQYANFDDEE